MSDILFTFAPNFKIIHIKMKELALKYGCNPNQKPSRIFMTEGELPISLGVRFCFACKIVIICQISEYSGVFPHYHKTTDAKEAFRPL